MMNYGMTLPNIKLQLPGWLGSFIAEQKQHFETVESRMQLAIELALLNVEHHTGGPFGAAIFNMDTHELVSVGVNLVVPSNTSIAHAEIIALTTAQQQLGNYDLGAVCLPPLELVTSSEPCAMCFGAIPWSGVRHLVCGARDEDARSIGFDEGPKHPQWVEELMKRGITVEIDVCREKAAAVLTHYAETEGAIYNARQG